jgi:hypothetical protein
VKISSAAEVDHLFAGEEDPVRASARRCRLTEKFRVSNPLRLCRSDRGDNPGSEKSAAIPPDGSVILST